MRGTSDRLRGDMDEEASRLARVAAGYRMTGDSDLARTAAAAAQALRHALDALDAHTTAHRRASQETAS